MTPKEKASELYDSYYDLLFYDCVYGRDVNTKVRDAALICADNIIYEYETIDPLKINDLVVNEIEYWENVKLELNKI